VFDGRWRNGVEQGIAPVGSRLGARRLRPNHLTALGVAMAIADAVVIATGHLFIGLLVLVLSAVPDLLDGAVAKATGLASARGAFFDSVADRVSDSLILGGIACHEASVGSRYAALLPLAVLATSNLISYERAKAESLGIDAKGGLMERAERIIALCIGLAFPVVLMPVLWVMLALTSITSVQRFVKVWHRAPGPDAQALAALDDRSAATTPTGPRHRATATSRWREWRDAGAFRSARTAPDANRWLSRRRGPRGERAPGSLERAWRRRDRSRP
jgi:CDP-diacylglycerol--glycerol-3-phosphate 3-phosphatidyltransferase